jgi:hypothetical protein
VARGESLDSVLPEAFAVSATYIYMHAAYLFTWACLTMHACWGTGMHVCYHECAMPSAISCGKAACHLSDMLVQHLGTAAAMP